MAAIHSQPLRYKGVDGQHMPRPLYPRERPDTGWVSLGAGLDGHGTIRSTPGSETQTASP